MSRETDSSSSGPQRRGGAAYPSGTPPYGTPTQAADEGTGRQAASEPAPERRTETTLTTRVRINIPGSRPIPPVVMRTPMSDLSGSDAAAAARAPESATAAQAAVPAAEPEPEPAPEPAKERTSDWFAPRKTKPAAGNGPATPGGSPAATTSGDTGFGGGTGAEPGPGATGPGSGPGGGFDDTASFYADFPDYTADATARGEHPGGDDLSPTGGAPHPGGPGLLDDGGQFLAAARPAPDPLTDPAPFAPYDSGLGPSQTPDAQGPGGYDVSAAIAAGPLGDGRQDPARSALSRLDDTPAEGTQLDPALGDAPYAAGSPSGPTSTTTGDSPVAPQALGDLAAAGVGPGMTEDTAVLTPQRSGADPADPADNVSGHTLNSGIPVVPDRKSPFAPGEGGGAAGTHTAPKLPEPEPRPARSAPPKPKKKGRNKAVLLVVAVVVVAGVAYGAGLLVNHSDVPKGTTVLGVDIGGGTRDEASKKLDAAFGQRMVKPLQLTVDGKTVSLTPDQAGLTLDFDATVQAAASSDYNPVTVIGSLFSGKHVVQPEMPVDGEKLRAALEHAAAGAGTAKEGTIRFVPGKAIAEYGKEGKGIDVAHAVSAVEKAYRAQVETGRTDPVKVPVTTRRPTVSDAEVDRMMNDFAKPAMSGIVTVVAGGQSIQFGPALSLPQVLGVKAIDGKLVDTYDREALKKLYGSTFDGVLITRGNGKKTPVTPEDVIGAMRKALLGKTPQERTATIATNPG